MGPFWDHNHEDYEYDYQVARYGKLGQKVAGWADAVEQAMGSGKQGSKPALSAACTAWKVPFLPIVYHAFCVTPATAMVELHWLEKSDSMIRHKNANGVDITVTVGTLARRVKNWSLNAKSKGKNAKVMWDMIREEVMEPIADGDIAILNCCRYVNEVKGERTVLRAVHEATRPGRGKPGRDGAGRGATRQAGARRGRPGLGGRCRRGGRGATGWIGVRRGGMRPVAPRAPSGTRAPCTALTVLHSNDKKLCLKTLSYGGWLFYYPD
jgi:hypothetical protein